MPTIVQEEPKADNQHECQNVQEPPGNIGPRELTEFVNERHDESTTDDKTIRQY